MPRSWGREQEASLKQQGPRLGSSTPILGSWCLVLAPLASASRLFSDQRYIVNARVIIVPARFDYDPLKIPRPFEIRIIT